MDAHPLAAEEVENAPLLGFAEVHAVPSPGIMKPRPGSSGGASMPK
jgi:hypothetical protein